MSSNLNRKILLLLECPACLEYMKAPIFSCVKGNVYCLLLYFTVLHICVIVLNYLFFCMSIKYVLQIGNTYTVYSD